MRSFTASNRDSSSGSGGARKKGGGAVDPTILPSDSPCINDGVGGDFSRKTGGRTNHAVALLRGMPRKRGEEKCENLKREVRWKNREGGGERGRKGGKEGTRNTHA